MIDAVPSFMKVELHFGPYHFSVGLSRYFVIYLQYSHFACISFTLWPAGSSASNMHMAMDAICGQFLEKQQSRRSSAAPFRCCFRKRYMSMSGRPLEKTIARIAKYSPSSGDALAR